MRPPVFVPDSRCLDDLLEDMQRDQVHIAMLVDEYGAIAGLISIEDILEEIVGEIADEYDATEMAPIEDLGGGKYRVVARLSLEELEELFRESDRQQLLEQRGDDPDELHESVAETHRHENSLNFTEEQLEEVDTVAGLGAFELGRVPIPGRKSLRQVYTSCMRVDATGGDESRSVRQWCPVCRWKKIPNLSFTPKRVIFEGELEHF